MYLRGRGGGGEGEGEEPVGKPFRRCLPFSFAFLWFLSFFLFLDFPPTNLGSFRFGKESEPEKRKVRKVRKEIRQRNNGSFPFAALFPPFSQTSLPALQSCTQKSTALFCSCAVFLFISICSPFPSPVLFCILERFDRRE